MTLQDLIHRLTELLEQDETLAEAPVLFAHQSRWPLQCSIEGPHVVCEEDDEAREIEEQLAEVDEADAVDPDEARARIAELLALRTPIVYLAEGSSRPWVNDRELSPYAPRSAWGEE